MRILVTGGAGFIGSNLVRYLIHQTSHEVLNVDKLTYAGNLESLKDVQEDPRYRFVEADLCDAHLVNEVFDDYRPDAVMHLAAESHVDRSIDGPGEFINTNILGTFNLLQCARRQWDELSAAERERFRFLHVSTDEVYGSLSLTDDAFTETTAYSPRSPYSASKAASDHLANAWHHTFKLPVLITNCSNNYGPFQFPEKLIPVVILKALREEPIPVYSKGENIRDWLYVEDHAAALVAVLENGKPGETYNIGGNNEQRNIDLVEQLCGILDELRPRSNGQPYSQLITFTKDRPGHDLRYAIDARKIDRELGWKPRETFDTGFRKTVQWYLDHPEWWEGILSGNYRLERIGLAQSAD